MKKIVVLVVCLLVMGTGAFALEKAAGGGVLLNYTFQGGSESFDGYSFKWTFNRASFGGFAFFGISQYVELNLAFVYKAGDLEVEGGGYVPIESTSALTFGVYGKYPIPMSDRVVLFPTGGLDFELNLEDSWKELWNDLWIRAGLGIDFFLTDTIFLRSHLVYGAVVPLGGTDIHPDVGHGILVKAGIGFMF
ncbi:MAG: hypothetical protein LBQ30_08330 [Treponema sp.]|nr:hypothetical protein [Treponema sp.]